MTLAGQRNKALLPILIVILAALVVQGCGGGSNNAQPVTPVAGTGTLFIQAKDAPLDNLVEFEITINSITLNPGNVSVLPQPERIELTSLQMTTDLVRLAQNVPAGTYTSVTLQLSNPEIKFCPDPPASCADPIEVEPPLQNATVTLNVTFTVPENAAVGLLVDFDLEASVVTDAGGNITGVNPVITATLVNVANVLDEFEGEGRVVSINRTSSTSGSFVLEVFEICQQVTINVNGSTDFEDFDEAVPPLANSFASLAVDQLVDVDADIQGDGALLAEEVEFEEPDDDHEAEGIILSVTRDGAGAVTEFTLVVQEVAPCSASEPANGVITVTVDANNLPDFRIDDDDFPVSPSLFDDPRDLEVGQKVEVEPVGALSANITAHEIKLTDQTIRGTVDGAPSPPLFQLDPASSLFPDQSITVETSGQTEFEGVAGVSSLASGQEVRVKGLLFLDAGELRFVAKKVDASP